jgi:hypothetical protein
LNKYLLIIAAFLALASLAGPPAQAATNSSCGFVYTDDNNPSGNTVTTFNCDTVRGLTLVGSTPTGGKGALGGLFAPHEIRVLKMGDALFVNDAGSGDIAIFTGASKGVLTKVTNFSTGFFGDVSMVSGGGCLVAGFPNIGIVHSYKVSTGSPYLTLVSSISTGAYVYGMSATRSGTKYYVAWANSSGVGYLPITPSNCALGSKVSSIAGSGLGATAGIAFSSDGSKVYVGDVSSSGTLVEEGPFPTGPLTAFVYTSGGVNSNSLVVDSTGTCLYVANNSTPGVTAIPMTNGIPGASSTFTSDGTGNSFAGNIIWHPSEKALFVASTKGSINDVDTFMVGTGCAVTLKNAVSTGQTSGFMFWLTSSPQYGY